MWKRNYQPKRSHRLGSYHDSLKVFRAEVRELLGYLQDVNERLAVVRDELQNLDARLTAIIEKEEKRVEERYGVK